MWLPQLDCGRPRLRRPTTIGERCRRRRRGAAQGRRGRGRGVAAPLADLTPFFPLKSSINFSLRSTWSWRQRSPELLSCRLTEVGGDKMQSLIIRVWGCARAGFGRTRLAMAVGGRARAGGRQAERWSWWCARACAWRFAGRRRGTGGEAQREAPAADADSGGAVGDAEERLAMRRKERE